MGTGRTTGDGLPPSPVVMGESDQIDTGLGDDWVNVPIGTLAEILKRARGVKEKEGIFTLKGKPFARQTNGQFYLRFKMPYGENGEPLHPTSMSMETIGELVDQTLAEDGTTHEDRIQDTEKEAAMKKLGLPPSPTMLE